MAKKNIALEAAKKDVTAEEAVRVLQAKGQENLAACQVEISEVLKKYGMGLQVVQEIRVVPKQ